MRIWTSSNENVATVDEDGVVHGESTGSCTITCSATDESEVTATCVCTILSATGDVTRIDIGGIGEDEGTDSNPIKLYVGTPITLTAIVYPPEATVENLDWVCYDGRFIGIEPDGLDCEVSAYSPGGFTAVHCKTGGENGVQSRLVYFRSLQRATAPLEAPAPTSSETPSVVEPPTNSVTEGEEDAPEKWQILLADELIRPTVYYAAYLTALAIKDDNAAEKLLAIAKELLAT